ncbi:cupin domain-containing protein [Fluviispira vulneris]|uniref:cupin domain-containing protein n=1 Tax=Fluviispira vulneris TaxID=2763012 RepID=UPI0016469568|nr:cupin domain-containing protein [Fluviispira vulneris]
MYNSRLVIVDNIGNNTSSIVEDKNINPIIELPDGHKITQLWYNEKTPNEPNGEQDKLEQFNFNIKPGAVQFIKTIFPPFSEIEVFAKENSCTIDANTYGLHSTTTIDFAVVVKGQMQLTTENGIVKLNEGDCLVQKATVHGWINISSEPAVMVFVMLGAHVPKSFKIKSFQDPISGREL